MCIYSLFYKNIYPHSLINFAYVLHHIITYILTRVYILYVCMHAHLKYSAVTYNKKFRFCNLRYGGKNIIHLKCYIHIFFCVIICGGIYFFRTILACKYFLLQLFSPIFIFHIPILRIIIIIIK